MKSMTTSNLIGRRSILLTRFELVMALLGLGCFINDAVRTLLEILSKRKKN